jgi:hypothetical protein
MGEGWQINNKMRISAIVTTCYRFSVTGKVLVFEGTVIVV